MNSDKIGSGFEWAYRNKRWELVYELAEDIATTLHRVENPHEIIDPNELNAFQEFIKDRMIPYKDIITTTEYDHIEKIDRARVIKGVLKRELIHRGYVHLARYAGLTHDKKDLNIAKSKNPERIERTAELLHELRMRGMRVETGEFKMRRRFRFKIKTLFKRILKKKSGNLKY